MEFDWAQAPPYNYSVRFHNLTNGQGVVVASGNVSISNKYDPEQIASIVPVEANTTRVNITGPTASGNSDAQEAYTSRYATLSIWGSWANGSITRRNMSGDGASVAEWAIIVEDPPSGMPGGVDRDAKLVRVRRGLEASETRMLGLMGRYNQQWMRRRGRGEAGIDGVDRLQILIGNRRKHGVINEV